jgi:hypothetical protein
LGFGALGFGLALCTLHFALCTLHFAIRQVLDPVSDLASTAGDIVSSIWLYALMRLFAVWNR